MLHVPNFCHQRHDGVRGNVLSGYLSLASAGTKLLWSPRCEQQGSCHPENKLSPLCSQRCLLTLPATAAALRSQYSAPSPERLVQKPVCTSDCQVLRIVLTYRTWTLAAWDAVVTVLKAYTYFYSCTRKFHELPHAPSAMQEQEAASHS